MVNAIMFIIFLIALFILFKEIKEHRDIQLLFNRSEPIYLNRSIWYSFLLSLTTLILSFAL